MAEGPRYPDMARGGPNLKKAKPENLKMPSGYEMSAKFELVLRMVTFWT